MTKVELIKSLTQGKIADTLLSQFYMAKLETYKNSFESSASNKTKHHMSAKKYKTSLIMITSLKQKEIAEALNVSYGLIRKWNTENPFKSSVLQHCKDFAHYVVNHVRKELASTCKTLLEGIETEKFILLPTFNYAELKDASLYGECVKMNIWLLLEKSFSHDFNVDIREFFVQMTLCDLLIENILFPEHLCSQTNMQCKRYWDERFVLKIANASIMLNQYLLSDKEANGLDNKSKKKLLLALSLIQEHIKKDLDQSDTFLTNQFPSS